MLEVSNCHHHVSLLHLTRVRLRAHLEEVHLSPEDTVQPKIPRSRHGQRTLQNKLIPQRVGEVEPLVLAPDPSILPSSRHNLCKQRQRDSYRVRKVLPQPLSLPNPTARHHQLLPSSPHSQAFPPGSLKTIFARVPPSIADQPNTSHETVIASNQCLSQTASPPEGNCTARGRLRLLLVPLTASPLAATGRRGGSRKHLDPDVVQGSAMPFNQTIFANSALQHLDRDLLPFLNEKPSIRRLPVITARTTSDIASTVHRRTLPFEFKLTHLAILERAVALCRSAFQDIITSWTISGCHHPRCAANAFPSLTCCILLTLGRGGLALLLLLRGQGQDSTTKQGNNAKSRNLAHMMTKLANKMIHKPATLRGIRGIPEGAQFPPFSPSTATLRKPQKLSCHARVERYLSLARLQATEFQKEKREREGESGGQ
eukprot:768121-Hanusia_phi.AAC.4